MFKIPPISYILLPHEKIRDGDLYNYTNPPEEALDYWSACGHSEGITSAEFCEYNDDSNYWVVRRPIT